MAVCMALRKILRLVGKVKVTTVSLTTFLQDASQKALRVALISVTHP